MNIISHLSRLWMRFRRRQSLGDVYYVESMKEVPDNLGKYVYVVGINKPKWVIINCPCKCGERLAINLMKSHYPRWNLKITDGVISLWPSLWMQDKKCSSHFWIKESRVIWVSEK